MAIGGAAKIDGFLTRNDDFGGNSQLGTQPCNHKGNFQFRSCIMYNVLWQTKNGFAWQAMGVDGLRVPQCHTLSSLSSLSLGMTRLPCSQDFRTATVACQKQSFRIFLDLEKDTTKRRRFHDVEKSPGTTLISSQNTGTTTFTTCV